MPGKKAFRCICVQEERLAHRHGKPPRGGAGQGILAAITWRQVGQNITGEASGDEFGFSVSISDDGETIAIGAHYNNGINGEDSGHVRIYQLDGDGTNWDLIGDVINGDAAGDESGYSVALSANERIVVIGAPWAYSSSEIQTGEVKVYQFNSAGSNWEQLGKSIYGNNSCDNFGRSVDTSYDGNTIALGSDQQCGDPGYVRVFSLEGSDNLGNTSDWKQIGQDITGTAFGSYFGTFVSLSNDGKTIAIGAPYANEVSVYRMDDSESEWIQLGQDIDGEDADDFSGWAVSLTGDGNTVAIGGQVRVFSWNDS